MAGAALRLKRHHPSFDIAALLVGTTLTPDMITARLHTNPIFHALLRRRGGNTDARKTDPQESCSGRMDRIHRLLVAEQDAPLGSHIVTPRRGYLHHGIYAGDGKVVHYAGLAYGLNRGPVEEVSLTGFARGRPVWIRYDGAPRFDSREVVCRARSRVGEDCYRLLTNNCEHFCEWCLRGEPRSHQVEAWREHPRRALHTTIRLLAQPLSAVG
jgi:Lecithin retinol acyltransferase